VDAAAASAKRAGNAKAWTTGMDAAEEQASTASSAAPVPPTPAILKDWTGPDPLGEKTLLPAGSAPIPSLPTGTPSAWTAAPVSPDESWDTDRDDDAPAHEHGNTTMPMPDADSGPSWPPPSVPGAYVAPAIVPTAAAMVDGRPATAASIAAAAVAEGTLASIPAEPRPDRWYSVPSATRDGDTPGKAGLFSDLPFRTPKDLPGWAVAVASLIGAVAFLLPFSGGYVIGGGVDPSYFGLWGLASPANLIVMLLSVALLLVTLIPSRIPVSIRAVVLPILLGGWFLGIVWSYATGPFGLGLGVDAIGIGGIVLVIGGALAAARADDPPKPAHEPDAA
jgi:hypothetical protein